MKQNSRCLPTFPHEDRNTSSFLKRVVFEAGALDGGHYAAANRHNTTYNTPALGYLRFNLKNLGFVRK
jgi:hypothetical protein